MQTCQSYFFLWSVKLWQHWIGKFIIWCGTTPWISVDEMVNFGLIYWMWAHNARQMLVFKSKVKSMSMHAESCNIDAVSHFNSCARVECNSEKVVNEWHMEPSKCYAIENWMTTHSKAMIKYMTNGIINSRVNNKKAITNYQTCAKPKMPINCGNVGIIRPGWCPSSGFS